MKKQIVFWWKLVIQIIVLFSIAMAMTFVNDKLKATGFFGDTPIRQNEHSIWQDHYVSINDGLKWGTRHYWYFWLMVILFFCSVIRIIIWADWFWSDNNKRDYTEDDERKAQKMYN